MAKVLTDAQNYTDIANAIRAKNKLTTKYKPSEMAAAIASLVGGETATLTTNALESVTATVYNADGTTTSLSIPSGTSTHTVPKYAFINLGIECSGSFEWGGSSTGDSGQIVSAYSGCEAFNAVAQASSDDGTYIYASETTAGIIVTSNQASITINREMDVILV